MTKQLYVSSAVQAALLKEILIPEMATGFWKAHRPADHAAQWSDVEIIISETDQLGPVNFIIPRLYNFVNPGFIKPNEDRLVNTAQAVKAGSNFRSVKKELIELSRIVGGRLTSKSSAPTKANRGNNKTTTEAVKKVKTDIKKPLTAVKKQLKPVDESVTTIQKTSSGATIRRSPIAHTELPTLPSEVEVLTQFK